MKKQTTPLKLELVAHVVSEKRYHEALDEVAGALLEFFSQLNPPSTSSIASKSSGTSTNSGRNA
jgi:hypothetical protein